MVCVFIRPSTNTWNNRKTNKSRHDKPDASFGKKNLQITNGSSSRQSLEMKLTERNLNCSMKTENFHYCVLNDNTGVCTQIFLQLPLPLPNELIIYECFSRKMILDHVVMSACCTVTNILDRERFSLTFFSLKFQHILLLASRNRIGPSYREIILKKRYSRK